MIGRETAHLRLQRLVRHVAAERLRGERRHHVGQRAHEIGLAGRLDLFRAQHLHRRGAGEFIEPGGARARDDDGLRFGFPLAAAAIAASASCACSTAGVQAMPIATDAAMRPSCAARRRFGLITIKPPLDFGLLISPDAKRRTPSR